MWIRDRQPLASLGINDSFSPMMDMESDHLGTKVMMLFRDACQAAISCHT
jgi:hypothetical protein